MPRCAQIELELTAPANGLISTSSASSIASRTWPCIFSRWRSVFGGGLAWFTFGAEFTGSTPALTLATWSFEPFWAWSIANMANEASTTSAAIVDTHVRSREITRQISAVQRQTFATRAPAPTREAPLSFARDVVLRRPSAPPHRWRAVRAGAAGVGPGRCGEAHRRRDRCLVPRRRDRLVRRREVGATALEAVRRENGDRLHARL